MLFFVLNVMAVIVVNCSHCSFLLQDLLLIPAKLGTNHPWVKNFQSLNGDKVRPILKQGKKIGLGVLKISVDCSIPNIKAF